MGDVKFAEARGYAKAHERILAACNRAFESEDNRANCSGFIKAVAADLGITVGLLGKGQANDIYSEIQNPPWISFGSGHDGAVRAAYAAREGFFVVAAWKNSDGNGHVAVITDLANLRRGTFTVSDRNVAAAWGVLDRSDLAENGGFLRVTLNPTTKIPNTIYAGQYITKF